MKKTTLVTLLFGAVTLSSVAAADVLSQKTQDAKADWESAKEVSASAEARKKEQDDALLEMQKPIKSWGKIQEPDSNAMLAPWCDKQCVNEYNKLKSADGSINSSLLLSSAVLSNLAPLFARVSAAVVAAPPPSKTDIALVIARLDGAPLLTSEQKAVLVAACYRAPETSITVEQCMSNVAILANNGNSTARDATNIANIASIGQLPSITLGSRALSFCDVKCHESYLKLISKTDSTVEFANLPNQEVCGLVDGNPSLPSKTKVDEIRTVQFVDIGREEQKALVLALCPASLPTVWGAKCKERLDTLVEYEKSAAPVLAKLKSLTAELDLAKKLEARRLELYRQAQQSEVLSADTPSKTLGDRLAGVRRARCATAYCWGGTDGRKYAVEPTVDLPIGMYWSAGGGALAQYVNANNIKIHAAAGLRYWFAYDAMSIGILLAQPELTEAQSTVDFKDKTLSTSQIRRPYPTLIIGVWGDIIQLSVSYDELRNPTRSSANYIQDYPANAVLSRAVTFGVALNPVTAARNGIGAGVSTTEVAK